MAAESRSSSTASLVAGVTHLAGAQEILRKQREEIDKLKQQYTVIEMTCNPSGAHLLAPGLRSGFPANSAIFPDNCYGRHRARF